MELIEEILNVQRPIVAVARDFPDGHTIDFHQHDRSQLLYAVVGVMTVTTEIGVWVVPPFRAIWLPAHTEHQIFCSGELKMRTIYLDPKLVPEMSNLCNVVSIPPLLRELILYAVSLPRLYKYNSAEERILMVILDHIKTLKIDPLDLKLPKDDRLQIIYQNLNNNPADNRTLESWAKLTCTTSRTLARLFKKEIGISFNQWRQQIRILEALRQLGQNESVTMVALNLGYNSPSAFISMFKKALGKTPNQYFNPEK
jgi:AraC-like DNA-binding protein